LPGRTDSRGSEKSTIERDGTRFPDERSAQWKDKGQAFSREREKKKKRPLNMGEDRDEGLGTGTSIHSTPQMSKEDEKKNSLGKSVARDIVR